MINNPTIVSTGGGQLANCSLSNETRFESTTFYYMNKNFEIENVSVLGYENKEVQIPIGTLFCYSVTAGKINYEFNGNVEYFENGVYKVTGNFSIRVWQ